MIRSRVKAARVKQRECLRLIRPLTCDKTRVRMPTQQGAACVAQLDAKDRRSVYLYIRMSVCPYDQASKDWTNRESVE